MSKCFSSARMASLGLRPYFERSASSPRAWISVLDKLVNFLRDKSLFDHSLLLAAILKPYKVTLRHVILFDLRLSIYLNARVESALCHYIDFSEHTISRRHQELKCKKSLGKERTKQWVL